MDRYVKGLLTAYDRILNLIEAIDPDHIDLSLECLRMRIEASVTAYKLFSTKEAIDNYESEYANKIKALEGTLTLSDIDIFISKLNSAQERCCKILSVAPDRFTCNYEHKE